MTLITVMMEVYRKAIFYNEQQVLVAVLCKFFLHNTFEMYATLTLKHIALWHRNQEEQEAKMHVQ